MHDQLRGESVCLYKKDLFEKSSYNPSSRGNDRDCQNFVSCTLQFIIADFTTESSRSSYFRNGSFDFDVFSDKILLFQYIQFCCLSAPPHTVVFLLKTPFNTKRCETRLSKNFNLTEATYLTINLHLFRAMAKLKVEYILYTHRTHTRMYISMYNDLAGMDRCAEAEQCPVFTTQK